MKLKFNFRPRAAHWENLAGAVHNLPGGRRRFSAAPEETPVFTGFSGGPEIYFQVAQPLLKGGQ